MLLVSGAPVSSRRRAHCNKSSTLSTPRLICFRYVSFASHHRKCPGMPPALSVTQLLWALKGALYRVFFANPNVNCSFSCPTYSQSSKKVRKIALSCRTSFDSSRRCAIEMWSLVSRSEFAKASLSLFPSISHSWAIYFRPHQ